LGLLSGESRSLKSLLAAGSVFVSVSKLNFEARKAMSRDVCVEPNFCRFYFRQVYACDDSHLGESSPHDLKRKEIGNHDAHVCTWLPMNVLSRGAT